MPIYEYRCSKCGHDFEEIVGANDPAPECPSCNSPKTEKLISKACFRTCGCAGGDFGGDSGGMSAPSGMAGGGCSGCSGGNCASCH